MKKLYLLLAILVLITYFIVTPPQKTVQENFAASDWIDIGCWKERPRVYWYSSRILSYYRGYARSIDAAIQIADNNRTFKIFGIRDNGYVFMGTNDISRVISLGRPANYDCNNNNGLGSESINHIFVHTSIINQVPASALLPTAAPTTAAPTTAAPTTAAPTTAAPTTAAPTTAAPTTAAPAGPAHITLFNNIKNIPGLVGYYIPESITWEAGTYGRIVPTPINASYNTGGWFAIWPNMVTINDNTNRLNDFRIYQRVYVNLYNYENYKYINIRNASTFMKLDQGLPQNYTLFHIARYEGDRKNKIFNAFAQSSGSDNQWYSGFTNGKSGTAGSTQYGEFNPNSINRNDNWVLSTDQLNMYRSNGITHTSNISRIVPNIFGINLRQDHEYLPSFESIRVWQYDSTSNASNCSIAIVIIFNRQLSSAEINSVETLLSNYYNIPLESTTR